MNKIKNVLVAVLILTLMAAIAAGVFCLYRIKHKTMDELEELERQKSQMAYIENLEYAMNEKDKYDFVVVLNPAHGGIEKGNTNAYGAEKDIALSVCLKVMEKNEDSSIGIFLTRTKDVGITDEMRVTFLDQVDPDLFIDVHLDKASQKDAAVYTSYDTTYYNRKFSNVEFADLLERSVVSSIEGHAAGLVDVTGTEDAVLLGQLSMPAVRISCGNMAGEEEGEMLGRDNYQNNLAAGLFNGIKEAKETWESRK